MKITTTLLGVSLALSATGLAQLSFEPSWGSQSFGSIGDRRFTSTSTNVNFAPSDGGAGSLTSSTSLTEPRGTASSSGTLDASDGLSSPLIRTFATTGPSNSTANGSAVVIEGYTYNGAGPATFNLDANLSGSFSNIDIDSAGNFATLSIWTPESDFGFGGDFFFSTGEGSYFEFGFNQLDTLRLEQNGIGTDDLLSGTLTWEMNPGDTVYLWASGRSQVFGPNSTADARNTLTTSFQDTTGLLSLSGGVIPEPSVSLLSLLGALALTRRKR